MKSNCQSEVGKIERLLLKHPRDAFLNQENINNQWQKLNYSGCPDFDPVMVEYDSFVDLLKRDVSEIHFLPQSGRTGLDSVYVHDPVIITEKGAILCSMGKQDRRGEPAAVAEFLVNQDIQIVGAITSAGRLEGGDVLWLGGRTLAVGLGYRTNEDGIRQLKELTDDIIDEFMVVPLPHWSGPDNVLHLMTLISPVDYDLAVVYSRLLPVPFRKWLIDRGMKLVEVPDTEFETMACNVLAVAPRKCIVLSGNPITKRMLENEGVEVREFRGDEICRKGAGGPTCLTRPLLRVE